MLKIEKNHNGHYRLSGRFDAAQAEEAEQILGDLDNSVTLDFSDLDYISSSGLTILIQTHKRLDKSGHQLKLVNLNDHIRDVFMYTRLDQVFDIE